MTQQRIAPSRWWWIAAIPVIATVVPGIRWYAAESSAATEIRAHLTSLRASGVPVDEASFSQSFDKRTSRKHSLEWERWISASFLVNSAGYAAKLKTYPQTNNDAQESPSIARQVSLAGDNPVLVARSEMLSGYATPLIRLASDLTSDRELVWMPPVSAQTPKEFSPLGFLWQSNDLLMSEAELAFHLDQTDRTVEVLQTLSRCDEAFDWQSSIRGEFERSASIRHRNNWLQRSLDKNRWNAEQLQKLFELVGPVPPLAARWHNIMSTERALDFDALNVNEVNLSVTVSKQKHIYPTEKVAIPATRLLDFVMDYDAAVSVGDFGYTGLQNVASSVENSFNRRDQANSHWFNRRVPDNWNEVLGHYRPHVGDLAKVLIRLEDSRRMTRTALAIKMFRLANARWPEKLTELELPTGELQYVDGSQFEIRAAAGGDQALLVVDDIAHVIL